MFSKNTLILMFLLLLFFIKGVILALLFPLFQGPDEQVHYATIQHTTEPREKNWLIKENNKKENDPSDVTTYNLTEETVQSAVAVQFDEIKWQKENTQEFKSDAYGLHEERVISNNWKNYIDSHPKNTSGTVSFYYDAGAFIEKVLSHHSLFTRFFFVRVFSVLIGSFIVLLSYLISKKVGFSESQSLLITTLVAFQPMFSATASIVNIDILLVFSFSLFIYAGIRLLRDGFLLVSIALLLSSLFLGFYSKGPGILMIFMSYPLIVYVFYSQFSISLKKLLWGIFLSFSTIVIVFFLAVPNQYIASIGNLGVVSRFDSPLISIKEYTQKTLNISSFLNTDASYWGYFGWLDTKISLTVLSIIWLLQIFALLGVFFFFRIKHKPSFFLPERKYILFFIGTILCLQIAIRFFDWRIFDTAGRIIIGSPGRYFLPNIIPHLILLVTGLGFFTRSKKQFDWLLKILALLMILLSFYSIINVIIPRYYL